MDDRNRGASGMNTLAGLQRDFQRFILSGEPHIARSVNATEHVPVATRLAIYSDAYRVRLAEALASNVPRLQQLLGAEAFAAIAQQYIDQHPSGYASIRWFGDRLADFLRHRHASQPWLPELAQWEWAIATAFDAADAAPLALEQLASVTPEEWPALMFRFHPSLQRLDMRTNAPALFKALSDEQAMAAPAELDRAQPWLIWRQALKTQYRSLSEDEAAALDQVRAGGNFEAMCDLLREWHAEEHVPAQAAGMLKRWIVDELIVERVTAAGA